MAVVHAERGLVAHAGAATYSSFVRSAIKMFQALPLVEDGGVSHFDLSGPELAVCIASHNAEPFHVEAAESVLRKAGATEADLACGAHPPMLRSAAVALTRTGRAPSRIHNNCSGKHAGLLALCRLNGWSLDGYHHVDHPSQRRVQLTLATWSGHREMDIAVDGCGLPTFALPLDAAALACARLAAAAADQAPAPMRVVSAMTTHPEYVAGTDRLCTDLMRRAGGRVFAKVGAEGYYCAGVPGQRLGIALKVEDGAKRASEPALLAVLHALNVLTSADLDALASYARPAIRNTRDEPVGEIRARIELR